MLSEINRSTPMLSQRKTSFTFGATNNWTVYSLIILINTGMKSSSYTYLFSWKDGEGKEDIWNKPVLNQNILLE